MSKLIEQIISLGHQVPLNPLTPLKPSLTSLQFIIGKPNDQDGQLLIPIGQEQITLMATFGQKDKKQISQIRFIEIGQMDYVMICKQEFGQDQFPVKITNTSEYYPRPQYKKKYIKSRYEKPYVMTYKQGLENIVDIIITREPDVVFEEGYKLAGKISEDLTLIYKQNPSLLNQLYKPAIVSWYPEKNPFQNLEFLCFPEGIHMSSQLKLPYWHNFILTNQIDKYWATVLVFWQQLQNFAAQQQISSQDKSIQSNIGNVKTSPVSIQSPRQDSFVKYILKKESKKYNQNKSCYIEKALCIISKQCYTAQNLEILKHLYRLHLSVCQLPIEAVVKSICDITMPEEKLWGSIGIIYDYGHPEILYKTSKHYPDVNVVFLISLYRQQAYFIVFHCRQFCNCLIRFCFLRRCY